jgi:hypothetical protein
MQVYRQTYTEKLREYFEEQKRNYRKKLEDEAIEKSKQCKSVKPLIEQVTELMRSLPSGLINRPWSMADLLPRLQGRYREKPHAQQVGEALRKLGWTRKRMWGKGYEGVRIWFPPRE